MQKSSLKASILIWATFLSLIITVTFISISTKINKNLKNNTLLTSEISLNNQIQNIINSWSIDWIFSQKYILDNWDKLIFNINNITKSLKKLEEITIKIINADNLEINILEWWPIIYKNITNSWIINNSWIIWATIWDLLINNLWWYTKIQINSDINNSFLLQDTDYKIIKQIWNKEVIKSKWTIKNF